MVVCSLITVMLAFNLRRAWRAPRPDSEELWLRLSMPFTREGRRDPRLGPTLNLALLTVFAFIPLGIVLRQLQDVPKTDPIRPTWLGYAVLVILAGLAIACLTIYWFNRPRFLIPPALRPPGDDQMAILSTQVVAVWDEQNAEPLGALILRTGTARRLLIGWWGGRKWETLPDNVSPGDVTTPWGWRALTMELPSDWQKGYLRAVGGEVQFVVGKPPRRLSRPTSETLPPAAG